MDENYQIMENMKMAMGNRRVPNPFPPTAGTISCPDCRGNALVHRHTPNVARMFGMEPTFWEDAAKSFRGYRPLGSGVVPGADYWEYPGKYSGLYVPEEKDKAKADKSGDGLSMRALDQYSLEDYQIPYIQDNEEPENRARKRG
jgi:hypothetical protein